MGFMPVGLSELLAGRAMTGRIELAPVQYADVEVGDGRVVRCVSAGVFLARHAGAPVVLVLSRSEQPFGERRCDWRVFRRRSWPCPS
jgi:hypothetical protein